MTPTREDPIYDAALPIADARMLPPHHPGTWFCVCGAGWFGESMGYPADLRSHAVFRVSCGEDGAAHDPGLARFRPDTIPAKPAVTTPKTEAGKRAVRLRGLFGGETEVRASAWVTAIETEAMHVREVELRRSLGDEWGQRVLDAAREALLDILDLSKGEPRMGGGSSFPPNAHRMGRIHNRARAAFGEEPLSIENRPVAPSSGDLAAALDVERLAMALFSQKLARYIRADDRHWVWSAEGPDAFAAQLSAEYGACTTLQPTPAPETSGLREALTRASNRLDLYQTHDEDCARPIAGPYCRCSHGALMREIDARLAGAPPPGHLASARRDAADGGSAT